MQNYEFNDANPKIMPTGGFSLNDGNVFSDLPNVAALSH